MGKVIALIGAGIVFILLLSWWSYIPSAYRDFPPEFQKEMEKFEVQVHADYEGELGQMALRHCRQKFGIKQPVRGGMDVVNLGYGADKAIAFTQCVVDEMYPDPRK